MNLSRLIIILITACLVSSFSYADEETFQIKIPSSSCHDALIEFASQVGYDILFSPRAESKKTFHGISGEYTISSVLNAILKGSGLKYEKTGKQLRITQIEQKAVVMPVVTVRGYLRNANAHISLDDSSLDQFPPHQIPLSIQSVSREYIDKVQPRNIEDTLSYISGVEYYSSDAGIRPQYYSRGVQTPFSIDGKSYRRTSLELDPSVLERIDLVQGPSANFLSPGGLLNFVTKKPRKLSHGEFSITAGSEDFYRSHIDLNLANKNTQKIAFRVIAVAQKQKHIKKFAFREKVVLAPSLAFEFDNMSQLLFSAYHKSEDFYPNTFSLHPNVGLKVPRETTLSVPWAKASIRDSFMGADISNLKLNGWLVNAGVNVNYSKTDNTFIAVIPRVLSDGPTGDGRVTHYVRNDAGLEAYGLNVNRSYGLDLAAEKSISLLGLPSLLRFGADYWHHTRYNPLVDATMFTQTFDILEPNYGEMIRPPQGQKYGYITNHDHFYGLFISQSVYLPHNITLHSDLRYEHINLETVGVDGRIQSFFQDDNLKLTYNGDYKEFTPQLGINASFTDTFSSHLSYRESFSFQNVTTPPDFTTFQIDYLSPIDVKQIELAFKKEWLQGNLLSNITFYNIKRSNIIYTRRTGPRAGETTVEDDQSSKGVNFSLSGTATSNLEILSNISYNKNTIVHRTASAGGSTLGSSSQGFNRNKQPLTAKLVANAWLNYQVKSGVLNNFSLAIGIKHVGEKTGDKRFNNDLPAYTTYDGFITYTGWKNLSLEFSIRNLSDKYYYKSSLGTNYLVEEGDPRSYYLTLKSKALF